MTTTLRAVSFAAILAIGMSAAASAQQLDPIGANPETTAELTGSTAAASSMDQAAAPTRPAATTFEASPAAAGTAAPAGTKAAGTIRIGVAPSQAQMGQGNNAQGDYGTPIRNSIVLLMNGPAVDIVPLDSHLAMQLQAEAQQKQCDYVLLSNVAVKRSEGGGFSKFMKKAAPVASMLPMAGMAAGMSGAVAGQAAGAVAMAAAQSAQSQAMNQLSGFNGQIKSKDDVTVGYQLMASGQDKPVLQNALNGKAKNDGEDVLTPLLLKAAESVLTEVTKK